MLYDPKTQLDLVRQRHTDLRAVAGHGRLFGRRHRSLPPTPATAPAASPIAPPTPVVPLPPAATPAPATPRRAA